MTAAVAIVVALLVILAATHAGGWVARALRQPAVIGEMAAGLLLSPALIGALAPRWHQAIFTPAAIAGVSGISTIAVVLFMFLVATTDAPASSSDAARGRSALVVAAMALVVPFVLGAAVSWPYYPALAGPSTTRLVFTLFLGTSLSVTAFPVLARILAAFGRETSALGMLVLRCAATGDLVAGLMLVLLTALSRSAATPWPALGAVAIFVAAMAVAVRPLMAFCLERTSARWSLLVLGAGLIVTTIAGAAVGLHAALAGFLFGTALPARSANVVVWRPKIERVSRWLLPAFFGITGLGISAGTFSGGVPWTAGAMLVLAAFAGKIGGAYLGARAVRLPHRDALAIGALMNARGLVELVVVNLGAGLGIIGPALSTLLVAMTVITTATTSPLLSALGWRLQPSQRPS